MDTASKTEGQAIARTVDQTLKTQSDNYSVTINENGVYQIKTTFALDVLGSFMYREGKWCYAGSGPNVGQALRLRFRKVIEDAIAQVTGGEQS